uniref:PWWP domain containing protein, expressed n=2 Tax=Oryza sativa subsp. japonica TaxID=39947 RepID=Q53QK3_ORYSJ|nr:PWWP domain, putative [Oryza sativa Japonica Group]ABA92993.1 PWWP domain containing protein, expressed [Oryza sativa Japonica Group]
MGTDAVRTPSARRAARTRSASSGGETPTESSGRRRSKQAAVTGERGGRRRPAAGGEGGRDEEGRNGYVVAQLLKSPRSGRPKNQPSPPPQEEEEGNHGSARYDCTFQDEGGHDFAPPELVWGKVRSHPWWPGQVFDAADASKLALKHTRAGAPLVAYFWDKTFAWSDASSLLPFCSNFTRLASQSTMSGFVSAVDAALQEVGRRVEVGLSCTCFGSSIGKRQEIENSGIREGAYGAVVDGAYMRGAYHGRPFLDYILALGMNPLAGADRLELTTAKAQLRAFNCSRGSRHLPEFVTFEGIEDVSVAIPHTKRKRMDKSGGDDVMDMEKKPRRGESSSRKKKVLPEAGKKEIMDGEGSVPSIGATEDTLSKTKKSKNQNCAAKKNRNTSKDADGLDMDDKGSVPSKGATVDTSRQIKKSKNQNSAVNKNKNTSKDADGLDMDGEGSVPSKGATDDASSKTKKSKNQNNSAKKNKNTSKDADGLDMDDKGSVPRKGATDDTSIKTKKSKNKNRSAKKNKNTSKDADGLETVGASKKLSKKAVDETLSDSKSARRTRSTRMKGGTPVALKGRGKDSGAESLKVEEKNTALLKENKVGRRAGSARKKYKTTGDGDGLEDGNANVSVSSGKRSTRGETSVASEARISEQGRKKKKLSELMAVTDVPNPSSGGKSKARGKRSMDASTEKLEDPDRDLEDTMKTRKRKKLDTLGDLSSQPQPVSRKSTTKVGELMHKAAGQMSQTRPVRKANGAVSQKNSRSTKERQVNAPDKSAHSLKVKKGKTDTLTENSLSCSEMLSQLSLAVFNLKKKERFSSAGMNFFTDFRKYSYASRSDVEKEIYGKATNTGSCASFSDVDEDIPEKAAGTEPTPLEQPLADHMQDDYWADILINVEEPLSSLRKKKDKGVNRTRKKEHVKKPAMKSSSLGNIEGPTVEGSENKQPNAETQLSVANGTKVSSEETESSSFAGLVLHFSRPGAVPSRSDLIKIFSQYGPVNEAKAETANNANCAQVIFKRRMDAEAAFAGAGKIGALGPALVSFRLSDFPAAASGNDPRQGASKSD